MAIVMGKLGRLDESITHLRRRIEIGPPSADVHNAYGLILEKRQQIDDAIEQYETAIGIDPKHAAATAGLGRLKPS
jgi:tetratricopeptide (TPR) repeat protein